MTTKQAFEHLTAQRGWYALCNIDPIAARQLKSNYNNGKITLDKINELLKAAKYKHTPEKWSKPKSIKQR